MKVPRVPGVPKVSRGEKTTPGIEPRGTLDTIGTFDTSIL